MTTILKLGGSLVTEKDREGVVDRDQLAAACTAIAESGHEDLVLVHGGGSFGHPAAERYGVTTTDGTRDPEAIRTITGAMDRLNAEVVDALATAGVPAIGLAPRALARKDPSGALELSMGGVTGWLAAGQVPVLCGDLVAHEGRGATVVSGDTLAVELASAFGSDRLGFCSNVPGVLDDDGTVIPTIRAMGDGPAGFDRPDGADVSGGMGGKVATLLRADLTGSIFGIEDMDAFLGGGSPGTTVH